MGNSKLVQSMYTSIHIKTVLLNPFILVIKIIPDNFIYPIIAFLVISVILLVYNRYQILLKYKTFLAIEHEKNLELNTKTKRLINERDWLLKEIHHRVKNNLQIVISLLNTQSAYLDNEEALHAIKNSGHRMHAMSLIHQKLYKAESLSCINISHYAEELVNYVKDNFEGAKNIRYQLAIEDIGFDVSQALPLGLIMNEAITNAIKYAFSIEQQHKEINITLIGTDKQHYQLDISDNGKGMPDNFDLKRPNSLGMNLIKGLSRQLDGDLQLNNSTGCRITVKFERIKILKENALFTENC